MKKTIILATMIAASLAGCAAPGTEFDAADARAKLPHTYDFPVPDAEVWASSSELPTFNTTEAGSGRELWIAGPFASQADADHAKAMIAAHDAQVKAADEAGEKAAREAHASVVAKMDEEARESAAHKADTERAWRNAAEQAKQKKSANDGIARATDELNRIVQVWPPFAHAETSDSSVLLTHARCPVAKQPGSYGVWVYGGTWLPGCWTKDGYLVNFSRIEFAGDDGLRVAEVNPISHWPARWFVMGNPIHYAPPRAFE